MKGACDRPQDGLPVAIDARVEWAVFFSGQVCCVLAVVAIFGLLLSSVPLRNESPSFRNSLLFASTGFHIEGHDSYIQAVTPPPPPPVF